MGLLQVINVSSHWVLVWVRVNTILCLDGSNDTPATSHHNKTELRKVHESSWVCV